MATIREVRERLELDNLDVLDLATVMAMNGRDFLKEGAPSKPEMLGEFVRDPSKERYICLMLGLETEEEKVTRATVESAKAAIESAQASRDSAYWAMIAAVAAGISLIFSLCQLLWN